jgi:hypothetical protein
VVRSHSKQRQPPWPNWYCSVNTGAIYKILD